MKKILIIILVLSYPEIMSAQTIKRASIELNNLAVVQNSDSVINPPSELVVIEERMAGDFFVIDQSSTGADTMWTVLFDNVLKRFYETSSDQNYDFVALCPTKRMSSAWSTALNRHIDGIGGGYSTFLTAPNLKSLIGFDLFTSWNWGLTALDSVILNRVLVHEIGHHWLVDIRWPQHAPIGHWQYNLDLFNGDTRYIDPMAYYHWVIRNGQEFCVDGSAVSRFSDLSLYIMGLLPPDQVAPIYEHVFELKPGNDHYNMWGPACGENHKFTETRTITIQDIINANGIRNPSSEQSKKDFRIAFIIVTAKGQTAPPGFIDCIKKYKDALPEAWSRSTRGKSRMFTSPPYAELRLKTKEMFFNGVKLGQSRDSIVTITNTGNDTLKILNIVPSDSTFSVRTTILNIPERQSFQVPFRFTPKKIGTVAGTLLLYSNASSSPDTITVSGTGVGTAMLSMNTNNISFGSVKLGQSKDSIVTMTNTGNDTLKILNIVPSDSTFSVRTTILNIPERQSFQVPFRFTPKKIGTVAGTLLLYSNASSSPDTITVSGTGVGTAMLSMNTNNISFGSVKLGQSKDSIVTMTNTGNDTLKILNIVPSDSTFSVRTTILNIPERQSFQVPFRFTPKKIGTVAGTLLLYSNASSSPDTITVSGYGVGTAMLSMNTDNISFGSVKVGQFKDTTITMINNGSDTLKISRIVASSLKYTARPQVITIAPGRSFIDTLRYTPSVEGTDSARITVQSNTIKSLDTIKVWGIASPTTNVDQGTELPTCYALDQNYPNPFNPVTTISFSLPSQSFVSLKVYDALGREAVTIVSEEMPAGSYSRQWNAANMPSGIYFYRLQAGSFIGTKKLVLLR